MCTLKPVFPDVWSQFSRFFWALHANFMFPFGYTKKFLPSTLEVEGLRDERFLKMLLLGENSRLEGIQVGT